MVESNKIQIELSANEARIIATALRSFSPPKEDELISTTLYFMLKRKAEEKNVKL